MNPRQNDESVNSILGGERLERTIRFANPIFLRLIGNFTADNEEELRATQNIKKEKINKIFIYVTHYFPELINYIKIWN